MNSAMTLKVISFKTQSGKALSPYFGNLAAVAYKPGGHLPPSLVKPWRRLQLGQYPKGQNPSLKCTEMSLTKHASLFLRP